MKVVILCGGLGTRLREETEFRPKPMVPIGDRPILWHIMKIYAHYGFTDFILCLGYKGEIIKDYFRNYQWNTSDVTLRLGRHPAVKYLTSHEEENWSVTLAETGAATATGGRIKKIERYIGDDEHFLLTYGDGVADINLPAVIERHKTSGKTLTLSAVHPPGRFGELGFEGEHIVNLFHEKPRAEGGWINGGFFVASRRLFNYLENSEKVMLEQEPLRRLAAEGELQACRHDGFWMPMDTAQEHQNLNRIWAEGNAPWKIW